MKFAFKQALVLLIRVKAMSFNLFCCDCVDAVLYQGCYGLRFSRECPGMCAINE